MLLFRSPTLFHVKRIIFPSSTLVPTKNAKSLTLILRGRQIKFWLNRDRCSEIACSQKQKNVRKILPRKDVKHQKMPF